MDRYRRIPLTGHFPFISTINDPRTTIGPMARFVEDLALALPIISGMDWQNASVIPMPLADWRAIDVGSLRVAYYTYHAEAEPTRETAETCRQAAQVLASLGAQIVEVLPPRIEEASAITRHYWRRPESASAEEWVPDGEARLSSIEVEQHLFTWDRFRRSLIRFMADYDLILTPARSGRRRHMEPTPAGFRTRWPTA